MGKIKKTKKALILGLGAVALYKFINGEGMFNKPRFYNQYKAISRYLSSRYEKAYPGDVTKTPMGWKCIVKCSDEQFILNITKSEDGTYLFTETQMDNN